MKIRYINIDPEFSSIISLVLSNYTHEIRVKTLGTPSKWHYNAI